MTSESKLYENFRLLILGNRVTAFHQRGKKIINVEKLHQKIMIPVQFAYKAHSVSKKVIMAVFSAITLHANKIKFIQS
jgi:hypothetical protein